MQPESYFQAVIQSLGDSPEKALVSTVEAGQSWRRARSNAEASVDRTAAEPRISSDKVDCLNSMLASSHTLANAMAALEAGFLHSSMRTVPPALDQFARDVDFTLYYLSAALRGSAAASQTLPKLREDHRRLIEARQSLGDAGEFVLLETDRITVTLNTLREQVMRYVGIPASACSGRLHQQRIRRNRQIAHALTGRMKNGICNGRSRTGNPNFADAFGPDGIDVLVLFFHPERIHLPDIGVHRNVVLSQVVVNPAAQPMVHHGVLVKRHADAPNHTAEQLAARGLCIQDLSGAEATDHARHFDLPKVCINTDFRELSAERVHGVAFLLLAWLRVGFAFNASLPASAQQLLEALALRRIGPGEQVVRSGAPRPARSCRTSGDRASLDRHLDQLFA